MQFCVLLIIALVPLAIAPGLLSAFDITPKIAILLFCESALLLFCKRVVNGLGTLYKSAAGRVFIVCILAQWLSTAASTLASSNPRLSVAGSSWRRDGLVAESAIFLFAITVAAWLTEDQRRVRVLLRTAAITGSVAALYGIAQYFGWDPLLPSIAYQAGEGIFTIVRPPATFGHADYFADWLVMVVFLALALRNFEKPLANFTIAVGTLSIILSGTRSALLGLLTGFIVYALIARPRLNRKVTLALCTGIACVTLLYISPAGAKLRARVHWSRDDVSGGARLLLWKDSLHMALRRPLLGYGPETFTAQFPPFESAELSRAHPDFCHESPHNMFLDALVSTGFPGAIALLALCAVAVRSARKNAALAAAITGAIVCQQFMVLTIPTALYFYWLIAAAVALAEPPQPAAESKTWPLIPIAAAIACVFVIIATRLLIVDRSMSLGERRTEAGDVAGALEAFATVRRWEFAHSEHELNVSRAMTRLASSTKVFTTSVAAAQQATDSSLRATETPEDRQNAWYNYATISALRNDQAGVETGLRHAIDCAPQWFKPHWTLSQFLKLTGRHAEARREAAIALDLDGGHDPEVTATTQKILNHP